jgi:alpha-L-rhamnosidase
MTAPHLTHAKWIWTQETGCENRWASARKWFSWDGSGALDLSISADLRYSVWLNGVRLGFGPPKFHAETPTVDIYDLRAHAKAGSNLLAVQVYSLGQHEISSCMPRRGGLWVQVDQASHRVVSDSTWKMGIDPGYLDDVAWRGDLQPPSEYYDARLGFFHPELPSYDDSAWPAARELTTPPTERLEPRDIPFMTARQHAPDRIIEQGIAEFPKSYLDISPVERARFLARSHNIPDGKHLIIERSGQPFSITFEAASLAENQSLYALLDFGRIWTGYPCLKLKGAAGTIVDISYSEDLRDHRIRPDKSLPYHDRLILGDHELDHRITWPKCFRYLQFNVHGSRLEVNDITLERSTYPVARNGFFSSDHPVIDQAVEISLHTVQLCMEDSYMDTPWRERGSWLGDDLVKAQTANSYFGDYALARRFLVQHARGQRADGMLQGKYPGNVTSDVSTWTLRFPPSVIEYCAESGDWDLGASLWLTLGGVLSWLTSLRQSNGLFQAPPVYVDAYVNCYNFIDWSPIDMNGINAAWNAFAADCLDSLETIASMIGRDADAGAITALASAHRTAFQELLWDDRRGIFVNGLIDGKRSARWGAHENYLAILYGLATPDQTTRIIQRLRENDLHATFEARDEDYDEELPGYGKIPTVSLARSKYRWPDDQMVPIGTAYFAGYMLEALCKCGLFSEATRFIENRWGEFSRQGATTVWETWNTDQSLSHGWSASPAVFAARHILGVQRSDDTGEVYHILPRTNDFARLRGRVATRAGIVHVEWAEKVLHVHVPQGLRFFAGLPGRALRLDTKPIAQPEITVKNGIPYSIVELAAGSHCLEE